MKSLSVFAVLVFIPLGMLAQTQHLKFSQAGEFASFSTSSQFSSTSLSISRMSSTNSAPSATLNYTTVTVAPDFSSETFTQIIGEIPASDFTGQTTQHLVLDFDTSQLSSSGVSQSCTLDLVLFTRTCGPAPTGMIHLEFEENGLQRTRLLDFNEEITNGSTTTRIHQRSDNSTANMEGSIFGTSVSSTSANVGVNRDSSLEVIRN